MSYDGRLAVFIEWTNSTNPSKADNPLGDKHIFGVLKPVNDELEFRELTTVRQEPE